jgi:signal peptidase II
MHRKSPHAFSSSLLFWRWLSLSLVLVTIDQVSKLKVAFMLPLHDRIEVTPFFNLVHALNPGAAFSFLANAGGWQRHFFTLLGLLVILFLIFLLWRGVRSRLETLAYVFIVAGALGNVVDRLRIGAVIDFLDFHWQGWHWPAFNSADCFIVIGVGLMLLASFWIPGNKHSAYDN